MSVNTEYTLTQETLDSIASYWPDSRPALNWECLFTLPVWLRAWWGAFGAGRTSCLWSVRHKDQLIGIAPFMLQDGSARFMGDADVCDYQDVIVAPGRETEFFEVLLPHLRHQGISRLDMGTVRADSIVFKHLSEAAERLQCAVFSEPQEISLELELPSSWEGFLKQLTGKQRHEIRRKIRRLDEAAAVNFRVVDRRAEVSRGIDLFLGLFQSNRSDKADFMTDQRASFFRSLAQTMAEAHILKLFFLELDQKPAAAVMCFDYQSTVYLYNNGYDRQYRSLSVGLLSKVFTIQDSIWRGKNKYDFLKGTEGYKHRLGGKPVQLYRCQVELG